VKTKLLLIATVGAAFAGSAGATVINLTTAGTSGVLNQGIFVQGSIQPAGTGVFGTFLKYQPGGNQTAVQGYNTDARNQGNPKTQYDEQNAAPHTHSLGLNEIPNPLCDTALMPGCAAGEHYRQFDLDINQNNNDPLLSLDRVVIYQRLAGDLFGGQATHGQQLGATTLFTGAGDNLVYDSGAANRVDLNWAIVKGGSGKSDMYLYVPDKLFKTGFVYLYSEFGLFATASGSGKKKAQAAEVPCSPGPVACGGPQDDDSGFEEWGVRAFVDPASHVPEPGSIVLFGSSVLAIALWGRKRFAR
jgi:hypothetical protein